MLSQADRQGPLSALILTYLLSREGYQEYLIKSTLLKVLIKSTLLRVLRKCIIKMIS